MVLLRRFKKAEVLLLCLFLFIIFSSLLVAKLNIRFFYFNPDSVQSNFSSLKRGVDLFFKQNSIESSFQAFAQKVDFDRMVKEDKPALVFVPAWYYRLYGNSMGLQPILSSLNDGAPEYTKVLIIRKDEPSELSDISTKTVAMTSMGPDTENTFGEMYLHRYGVDLSKSNIIITPKDADALYALALGQVDAALVSRDTLVVIGETNKRVRNMVRELAVSPPLSTPVLCSTGAHLSESEIMKIKEIFLEGGNKSPLPSFMQMLRFDGWKEFHN